MGSYARRIGATESDFEGGAVEKSARGRQRCAEDGGVDWTAERRRQSAVVGPAFASVNRERSRPCAYAPMNIPATAQRIGQLPMPTLA